MSGYGFSVGSSGYDDVDRLVNWQRTDTNLDQSWNLSAVGNWNSITENTSTQNRTHGPTHELLTVTSHSVMHDAKGSMTSIPSSLRPTAFSLKLKWDFENKLIAADTDTDSDSVDDFFYKFDALGRRFGRDDGTANVAYFQDGQHTIADYPSGTSASSPTYTYVYASYIDEPVMRGGSGGLRYYHSNQQYSITALTDGGGSIVERYAYTAYGQVMFFDGSGSQISNSEISNRYTYTGREWDEGLNLYHYRARMYDAASGRFVSRDPIRHEGSNWGLYEFLESSPNNYLDYDGKIAFALPVVIPAGIAIAALKAAAIGMGVSMFTCLMLPECLGNAKDETLRDLEDKLEDLITIRIRPITEPKWDPVYFPPGPKNDDGDDDKRMIYHYAECGKSCVKPSDYVTDRRLISSYEPSLKEWGEMISITFIPDVRSKCKKICEYSMIDPGVSFDAMDPVRPGVRQAFLNTTICRPALTSSPPIKMPPLK